MSAGNVDSGSKDVVFLGLHHFVLSPAKYRLTDVKFKYIHTTEKVPKTWIKMKCSTELHHELMRSDPLLCFWLHQAPDVPDGFPQLCSCAAGAHEDGSTCWSLQRPLPCALCPIPLLLSDHGTKGRRCFCTCVVETELPVWVQ